MVLTLDNTENKKLVEFCYKRRKTLVNPIIDWTTSEVWEFIREYNVRYCRLYDEGFARLGCIGCPMGGGKSQTKEFERYPKYKDHYIKAFGRMLERGKAKGVETQWKNADDVFEWWVNGKANE